MPSLRHLLEDLQKLDVPPDDVRLPGTLYDSLIADAEESIEENPEEE